MSATHNFSPLTKALMLRRVFQPRLLSATLALALPFAAQVQAQTFNFNVPAQPLASALQAFGQQANLQVLYSPDDVQNLRSHAVSGALSPQAGIEQLLGEQPPGLQPGRQHADPEQPQHHRLSRAGRNAYFRRGSGRCQ